LNSDQAAAILRIHPKTLQRLARHGRVIGYRVGKGIGPRFITRIASALRAPLSSLRGRRMQIH
jgi:hypothetical protein